MASEILRVATGQTLMMLDAIGREHHGQAHSFTTKTNCIGDTFPRSVSLELLNKSDS